MTTIEDRHTVAIAALSGVLAAALMTLALLATEPAPAHHVELIEVTNAAH